MMNCINNLAHGYEDCGIGFPTPVIYSVTSANQALIEGEVESKNNLGNSSFSLFGNGDGFGVRDENIP